MHANNGGLKLLHLMSVRELLLKIYIYIHLCTSKCKFTDDICIVT